MGYELDPPQAALPPGLGPGAAPPGARPAAPPAPAPAASGYELDPKQRTWGEAASSAVSNLIPSAVNQIGQTVEGVGHMIKHPIDTGLNLGKLALSAMESQPLTAAPVKILKSLADMLPEGNPVNEYFKTMDAPKKALIDDYVKAYGGWDRVKETLATDPARIISDVATIASGGELALAKLPGVAGKIGKVAGAVANLDPAQAALKAVEGSAKLGAGLANAATGVGSGVMQESFRAGFRGGDFNDAFRAAKKGETNMEDVVQMARDGVQDMREKMYAQYRADEPKWKNSTAPVNFGKIDAAEKSVINSLQTKGGVQFSVGSSSFDQINKVMDVVNEWRKNPSLHNIEDLDLLKQRLWDEVDMRNAPKQVQRATQQMVNAIRDTIVAAAPPEYGKAMRAYHDMSTEIANIESALGVGKKAEVQTAMSKLQSLMRNNANTQYGFREQKLQSLESASDKVKTLRSALAGHAVNSWEPRGINRAIIGGGGVAGGIGAAAALGSFLPLAGSAAAVAASSPRLMGNLFQGAGRLAGGFGGVGALSRKMPGTAKALTEGARTAFSPLGYGAARATDRGTGEPFDIDKMPMPWAKGGKVERKLAFARYTS
jgi:hypothetical protein